MDCQPIMLEVQIPAIAGIFLTYVGIYWYSFSFKKTIGRFRIFEITKLCT